MIGGHFLLEIKTTNLQKKFIFDKIKVGKKQPSTLVKKILRRYLLLEN